MDERWSSREMATVVGEMEMDLWRPAKGPPPMASVERSTLKQTYGGGPFASLG